MLLPGAQVMLLDNSVVQCAVFPITETDPDGNTYQPRTLRDGSVHWVLKNFPSQAEAFSMVAGRLVGGIALAAELLVVRV